METKSCQRCHKLLRIEAKVCNRCGGQDFIPVAATRSRKTVKLALPQEEASFPSDAPASSHRAGHYSGLHPEDQPYQSSFLPVLPAAAPAAVVEKEPEALLLPMREDAYATLEEPSEEPASRRRVATYTPLPEPRQQRSLQTYPAAPPDAIYAPEPIDAQDGEVADIPTTVDVVLPPQPWEPMPLVTRPKQRGGAVRGGLIPVLLVLSCLSFLVATSILAFLLVNSKPVPIHGPEMIVESPSAFEAGSFRIGDTIDIIGKGFPGNDWLTFTRDDNVQITDQDNKPLRVLTYPSGNFSVEIMVTKKWSDGAHVIFATDQQKRSVSVSVLIVSAPPTPPQLRLSASSINAGPDKMGAVTEEHLALFNAGGGKVSWTAKSNSSWLSTNPQSGTIVGSFQQIVVIINRGVLAPGNYSGHLTFTQQASDGEGPLTLTLPVTMAVKAAPQQSTQFPPNLAPSTVALAFAGTPVNNPAGQALTLQNTGGQVLNWSVATTTTDGGNWLSVTQTSGTLFAGQSEVVTVSVSTAGLSAGTSYTGALTFAYGASSASVAVTLAVNPQPMPALAVQPANGLAFHSFQGQNPPAQSFTISNPGTAPLNWEITEDANGQAYAQLSQTSGTLPAGHSISITVTPSIAQVQAATVNAVITVGSSIKSQQVPVTFVIVNQAQISLNTNALSFNHDTSITNSTQTILLTDTGSATLDWGLTISSSSQVQWLTVDTTTGSLEPSTTTFINVTCDSSNLQPGTYTATIQLYDTDAGTLVQPQTVTVTLVVSS